MANDSMNQLHLEAYLKAILQTLERMEENQLKTNQQQLESMDRLIEMQQETATRSADLYKELMAMLHEQRSRDDKGNG